MTIIQQPYAVLAPTKKQLRAIHKYDSEKFKKSDTHETILTEKILNPKSRPYEETGFYEYIENEAVAYFYQTHDMGDGSRYIDPIDMKGNVRFRLAINLDNIDFDFFHQYRYTTYVSKAMREVIAQFDVKVQYLDVDDSHSNDFFRAKEFKAIVSNYMTDGIDLERSHGFLAPTNLPSDGLGAAKRRPWPIGVQWVVWKDDFRPKHHIFSDIHHWELMFSQEIVAAFKDAGLKGYDVIWLDSAKSLEETSQFTLAPEAIAFEEAIRDVKRNPRTTPYVPFEGKRPSALEMMDKLHPPQETSAPAVRAASPRRSR